MINKRFVMYEHKDNDYILYSPNTHLDFIEMLGDALSSEEIVDLLNEQDEKLNLLIAEARYINKQRHNLINFLKANGYGLEDIKKIMQGDD